ncbi:MAG: hypothetical protein QM662_18055 [Gordonia sp. (in: high G+C Gram-positive bacteria)]
MTYGVSTYLANALLNHAFRATTYTPPTTIYAKIHTGDPGSAGTSNASAATTRVATTWAAAASGAIALSASPQFTLTATETIAAVSFWDASTSGNFLFSAQATTSKGGVSGDIIILATAPITITPLAA